MLISQADAVAGTLLARRRFLLGAAAVSGLLALPGCATMGGQMSYTEAVRHLLELATRNAFARLTAPDGFWTSAVARVNMPTLFGKRGGIIQGILTSDMFREKLQHQLNRFAEDGARKAAPLVADTVRTIGIANAMALLKGEPTAATTFLRNQMGPALVNAMIPELDRVMRVADDPIVNQAISALAGVNIGDAAHALALEADNAIWYEIGAAEADIRRNPESTNDPLLIAALKAL
ncbi:DUF4197 domain-containing protein [Novosphingobium album (ex Liu et al. 2023)]|uniref:DUF4197 domain-containing protein n=1 Tax=Novosphingobium album (ex Liu et al. 2023) TaxID=3031130 RepID=A0ABT5WW30_9SPHN|nr:DUF4197 domain-containing protein [Novosphingobium album (ex Liu et al. 2023)]MDE8654108.1 DUF4197 domain-containing protein [Novosphingobium album (ex Liu et al. 2023)]